MVTIEERKSNKLPCYTSLFFRTPHDRNLFAVLAQAQDGIYNNKDDEFEFAPSRLFFLINTITNYEDASFTPYREEAEEEPDFSQYDFDQFSCKPYSFQLDGIKYGLTHKRWMLLDDQGLGKTLQVIYTAQLLKQYRGIQHCLIICGLNSLKYNWASEIERISDLSYTFLGQKTSSRGNISIGSVSERIEQLRGDIDDFFVITNIETLQKKKEFRDAYRKSKTKFDMIVLDEGHKASNYNTASVSCLMGLDAEYKMVLSGTIMLNAPINTYACMKWLGAYRGDATGYKLLYNVYGGFNNRQVVSYKNLDLLRDMIAKYSLRRLKTDVLDLPERTFIYEYVELGERQRKLYDEAHAEITYNLDMLEKKPSMEQELTMCLRLRQITAFPGIVSSDVSESAKLDRLDELLETITAQGSKVVVFSTFKPTVSEVAKRLDEKRLCKYVTCTGDDGDEDIEERKNIFQSDPETQVMIATWRKMGTGHTLTAASYAIFIDTPWTDGDFKQASDRIYRIGQKNNCTIITIIAKNTYDERVKEIVETKRDLSEYVIDKISDE